jgi:uncharacterized membrane-anchored protein
MDMRAQLQLRLQETVEGFSVVAISYYAVMLLSKLLHGPFDAISARFGIATGWLEAGLVIFVLVSVFGVLRTLRKKLIKG